MAISIRQLATEYIDTILLPCFTLTVVLGGAPISSRRPIMPLTYPIAASCSENSGSGSSHLKPQASGLREPAIAWIRYITNRLVEMRR
jgi:hypothetical protein